MKDLGNNSRVVQFPDGSQRFFEPAGGGTGEWRLTRLEDAFGNWMNVTYGATTWTLEDMHGREHEVRFSGGQVSSVRVERFGTDVPAVWTFAYTDISLSLKDCGLTSDPLDKRTFQMKFLSSITRPDGSSFEMPNYAISSGASLCNPTTGRIRELVLPTLGKIQWTYGTYQMGRERCATAGCQLSQLFTPSEAVQGVVERRLVRASGNVDGIWTYAPSIDSPLDASERTTLVTDPLGHMTKYYFSVHRHDTDFDGSSSSGWTRLEYGLPFTRNHPVTATLPQAYAPEVYLSQEIFEDGTDPETDPPIRSVYEREQPISLELEHMQHANRRLVHQLTLYHDTESTGGLDGFTETRWADFDGLGNFRTVTQGGNLENLNVQEWKEVHSEFNPGAGEMILDPTTGLQSSASTFTLPAAGAPWVLGTSSFTEHRQDDGATRRVETTYREDGFLLCQRRLADASGRSSNDVMVVYADEGDDGNAENESSYGGDEQSISTDSGCSASGRPEYRTSFEYSFGALSRSAAVESCTAGSEEILLLTDLDIDPHTGLAQASRDASGTPTSYGYDAMSRLTNVTPEANPAAPGLGVDAPTYYSYANASESSAAWVDVRRGSVSAPLTHSRMVFDGWGRLCREQTRLPDVWNDRRTSYTATGLTSAVSERISGGANPATACASATAVSHTSYTGYDPFGRPSSVVPPDGPTHEVSFTYTGARREVRSVATAVGAGGGEQQVARVSWFDSFGRLRGLTESSDPNGGEITTDYFYDSQDRLSWVRTLTPNPGTGNQHRFLTYDGRGFLVSEQHPELGGLEGSGSIAYTYDSRGNAVSKNDGRVTTRTVFDAAARPVRIEEELSPSSRRPVKEYFYTSANRPGEWSRGQLVEARRHHYVDLANPFQRGTAFRLTTVQRMTYGGRGGRLSSTLTSAQSTLGSSYLFQMSYGYDALGNVVSMEYPDCLHADCVELEPEIGTLTATYDEGLLATIPGYVNEIDYHPNGLVTRIAHSNGMVDTVEVASHGMARPHRLNATGASSWSTGFYGYDGAGNIKSIGGDVYTYDKVNRLLRADLDGTVGTGEFRTYSYDWHGNRIQIDRNGLVEVTPIDPKTNRLQAGVYDDSGNLSSFASDFLLSWDAVNTLIAHRGPDFSKVYLYTADDERLATIDITNLAEGQVEETWTLRGLGNEVLRTYATENGDWSWVRDHIYRSGQLAASETAEDTGALHYHLDHLGTPRLITQTDGTEKSRHVYFPFGEEWTAPGADRLKFTGHERDFNGDLVGSGDDLDYMHARYCSPAFGRFLSVDPIDSVELSVPQSWNKYVYALNGPVRLYDPDGLAARVAGLENRLNGIAAFNRRVIAGISRVPVFGELLSEVASFFLPQELAEFDTDVSSLVSPIAAVGGRTGAKVLGSKLRVTATAIDDPAAKSLAERFGGTASATLEGFGNREFDLISDTLIGQSTSSTRVSATGRRLQNFLNRKRKSQIRETLKAAKLTGRQALFEFTGAAPSDELLEFISRNADRLGLSTREVVILRPSS